MDRVRLRVEDKRVLALVKAFLKAGILSQDGARRDTDTGTPQGGHPFPAAGQHRPVDPGRALRPGPRRSSQQGMGAPQTATASGQANYRLIRYADDFLVMVSGTP